MHSRWLTYPIFIVSWTVYLAASLQIHHEMTPEELLKVFHVDTHHEVPEYEVVHVRSISKRETDFRKHVGLNAFGKKYLLKLQKNENLLGRNNKVRVWLADTNTSHSTGVSLQELVQEDEIGALYQDFDNEAALLVNHDPADDALLMDGSIGGDLVIKPLPSVYRKKYKGLLMRSGSYDDELFMDEEDFHNAEIMFSNKTKSRLPRSATETHTGAHVIYKTKKFDSSSDYAFMELDKPGTKKPNGGRSKRDAPPTIYPEILVIVDYDGYKLHGSDNVEIKKYFVSFWNGVDLRYKLLKGPKVRISIAGIIISRGRDATPYFEKNRVGRNAIDSTAALTDMGKYLFQERRLPVYDIAVAITKLDMCRREFPSDECNRGTAGFAYVGGACVVNKRLEKVNSVAIVEDTGGFSGIIVAAHEVGHLLGSVHDGSPPPSYLGGPGAQRCRWEDGYIMSDLRHTERGFKWSPCSIAQFTHFLNGETASCLYNSPHEDAVLPRVLPGKLLSLDAQCRMDRGTSACFKDDRVCAQLFCFDASSGYCVSYRPAAEGSACGDGHNCINGKCVPDNENAIPDFSENIDTFLRRTDTVPVSTQSKSVFTRSVSSTFPVTPASPPFFPAFVPQQLSTTTSTTTTTTTTTTTPPPTASSTSATPAWWQITTKPSTKVVPTRSPWWYEWSKNSSPASTEATTVPSTSTTTPRPVEKLTSPSTFTVSSSTVKSSGQSSNSNNFGGECQDKLSTIGGSMSCEDFLNRYGFQYCRHAYIVKNCCASHRRVCPSY